MSHPDLKEKTIVSTVAAYCLGNAVLMLMYANSVLGRAPFELIGFLAVVSFLAALIILLVYLMNRRAGFNTTKATLCVTALIGIGLFDFWCLWLALAAV